MTNYICRCEDITRERVEAEIAEGKTTLDDIKRHTRVGMGRCQGIYCLSEVRHLLGDEDAVPMIARPPVRQIRLDVLGAASPPTEND